MNTQIELLIRENKCVSSISRFYAKLTKFLHSEDDFNLVYYALFMEGEQTQKQISEGYSIPPQTVNNIVLSMKKKGFVTLEENQNDKRSKMIKFTKNGFQFAEKQIESIVSFEKKAISRMGLENYKKMIELQELLLTSMKEERNEFLEKFENPL